MRSLPVVFALHDRDGGYWLNTAVALTSVLQHASGPVRLYIVHDDTLGDPARRRLSEIATGLGGSLEFILQDLPPEIDRGVLGKFSPASIFRLMIPNLFPDEELVVYLDSDLVVNGVDLHELRTTAPADAAVSAVVDVYVARIESHRKNLEALELDAESYFNSGVLAFRPRLVGGDLLAEFAAFFAANPKVVHPDNDFLNLRFRGVAGRLDAKFNSLITFQDNLFSQPLAFYAKKVLHYAGGLKPLDGAISPAFLPFFAHAFMTPEIYLGGRYKMKSYVFPANGRPDMARALGFDVDPGPSRT